MAGINSSESVEKVALGYIASTRPHAECLDVSVLKLDATWLVQATVEALGLEPAERLVLVVSDNGAVEEVGGPATRQSAQRFLAAMKASSASDN